MLQGVQESIPIIFPSQNWIGSEELGDGNSQQPGHPPLWGLQSSWEGVLPQGAHRCLKASTDFYFLKCLFQEGNVRPASAAWVAGAAGSHTNASAMAGGGARWPGQPLLAGLPTPTPTDEAPGAQVGMWLGLECRA